MGRLFWKFFAAFWLSLMLTMVTVIAGAWLLQWFDPPEQHSFEAERLHLMLGGAVGVLREGGPAAATGLLRDWAARGAVPAMYIVDESGRELLGRWLPEAELAGLAARLARGDPAVAEVRRGGGQRYRVFAREAEVARLLADAKPKPPSIWVPITASALVSLAVSALLGWYFAKPVRSLRWALHKVADGRLDTRVFARMGRRRDEIADLGRDFDRMAQQLQQLVGAQQRLLHDVSHELRSPLARLQAAIGLARQRPDRTEASLERIEREAVRLDGLVGELLTLARLEAGAAEMRRERVDLVELIGAIAEDAQFEARTLGREVSWRAEGEFVVEVGAELLYRAFENVIRNAVKYTVEGSTVEVSVEAGPERLTVSVADRGPGIAPADLTGIFEPFRRLEQTREMSGFGLGLAIARRAIESHGGTITAEARPGGGLVMRLTLPRPPSLS
ncbi:HAMP domain-containing sensor histidine kinase [Chitinimonas lacunae]|uniref:histidine kinase n=1 Tax=Chitinimonas lacunae TaxID=1963018 RepID=A0ABV8MLI5_9NEIS